MPNAVSGNFEIHVTIDVNGIGKTQVIKVLNICFNNGYKLIRLRVGDGIIQTMTTTKERSIDEHAAIVRANDIAANLAKAVHVVRVKVEANANNTNVPNDEAPSDGKYFEFHFNVKMPEGEGQEERLKQALIPYKGRLSTVLHSNALLITLQFYACGKSQAWSVCQEMMKELHAQNFIATCKHKEFVVYDSNHSLDDEWV